MRSVLLFSLLAGCTFFEKHDERPNAGADLAELHAFWLQEIATSADSESGWPSAVDCDGTLWAGLASAAGAEGVKIERAEYDPGRIERRPTACWPGSSHSSISQDMLTGYLWALWRKGDLPALTRLATYGEAHAIKVGPAVIGWIMGEPPAEVGSVVARPNIIGMVGRMLFILSDGTDARSYRSYPSLYPPVERDFERHIATLGILLYGEVAARQSDLFALSIDGEMKKRLEENVAYDPSDAFFQAALSVYSGDASAAESLLKDPGYECPSYVRGAPLYCAVHKAFAASIVLKHRGA